MNKDFITGASYEASGFSVTNEIDHTTGSGKSAKMGGRKRYALTVDYFFINSGTSHTTYFYACKSHQSYGSFPQKNRYAYLILHTISGYL